MNELFFKIAIAINKELFDNRMISLELYKMAEKSILSKLKVND